MTEAELKRYEKLLRAKQEELTSGMQNRDEIAVERSADQTDEIQRAMDRDWVIRTLDSKAILLRSVAAALQRIEDGSFGTCISCDEEINPKRLNAVPWAPYCIKCQEAADSSAEKGEPSWDGLRAA